MTPEAMSSWINVLEQHWLFCLIVLAVLGVAGDWIVNVVRAARGQR
jgi:hypothetical protein